MPPLNTLSSSYDPIAELYHVRWADWYHPAALPAIDRLFLGELPSGAPILDLCCGSGHMSRVLADHHFQVTGIDSSSEMIDLARASVPEAKFLVSDAREFSLEACFTGAISTFDSLNHILELSELEVVFRNVHRSLRPGALFFFDVNMEEAYLNDWTRWSAHVLEESVHLIRGTYDPVTKLAVTRIIWFSPSSGDLWQRRNTEVLERCYTQAEITESLKKVGFQQIEVFHAGQAGMTGEIAFGRLFFRTRA